MKNHFLLLTAFLSHSAFCSVLATGTLVLPKELKIKAKGIHTVFITIKDPAASTPMPCAAQKFELNKDAEGDFLSFTLDSNSMMKMGCENFPDTMNLKAKLDKDSSAGPDSSGDIVGTLNGIKKGAKDLKIEMSKAIE